jgi:hypothetical protein
MHENCTVFISIPRKAAKSAGNPDKMLAASRKAVMHEVNIQRRQSSDLR